MTPQIITCANAAIAIVSGALSITCIPPTQPTLAPTPIATAAPISAAIACEQDVVNGAPLPGCVGTSFFPGTGIYRRIIAPGAQADQNSAAMVRSYFSGNANVVSGLVWHNGANQSKYSFGRPIYRATAGDPLISVHCTMYCAMGDATIRIPSHAAAEGGSDHHIAVLEPDNMIFDAWEFSGVNNGGATAGSLAISTVDGTSFSSHDLQPGWMVNAVTAGGMVTPSGIVTLAELQAGVITHELYGVVSCVAPNWYTPATQAASVCTDGRTAIPNGALIQYIPDGAAIAASSMSSESKIIALAMHTYGIRIADTGGSSGLMLQVENQAPFWSYGSGPDPFIAYAVAHGWGHVTASGTPPVDRYIHPLTDLNLPGNLRILSPGN